MPTITSGKAKLASDHAMPDGHRDKKLQALCNLAAELVNDDRPGNTEQFHILLNDLVVYTREHFKAREALLRQSNPQLLDLHEAEHALYEQALTDLLLAASDGVCDKNRLLEFLQNWCTSLPAQSEGSKK